MRLTIAVALLLLAGCEQFTAGKAAVLETGARVADETVDLHIAGLCVFITGGALQRKFMISPERWQTWNDLCRTDRTMPLLPEP